MAYLTEATKQIMQQLRLKGGVSTRTLTGALTIDAKTENVGSWDPGGASRTITLPAAGSFEGAPFFVHNAADANGEDLVFVSGSTTIATISRGATAMIASTGSEWVDLFNHAAGDMWANCPPASQSVRLHTFFDDFFDLAAAWTITEDDVADTQAVSDVVCGAVTLTCKATTDNDACQITWAQETFKLATGKRLWFEAVIRSASGDMVNSDWTVGLIEAEDLTGVADNMPANGVVFHKDDGAATFVLSSSDNGTNLQSGAAVGTIVNATDVRIGFYFDGGATGAATLTPYVNGVAGTPITAITYATMAELAPFLMVRNGDATTTQTLIVDYVKVVQER